MKINKSYRFDKKTIKEFEELKIELNIKSYDKLQKMLINNFKQKNNAKTSLR